MPDATTVKACGLRRTGSLSRLVRVSSELERGGEPWSMRCVLELSRAWEYSRVQCHEQRYAWFQRYQGLRSREVSPVTRHKVLQRRDRAREACRRPSSS